MQIGIIGLGLIGGSLALDLKKQLNVHVMGYDASPDHLSIAEKNKLIDETALSIKKVLDKNLIIICAVPVHTMENVILEILDEIKPNQTLIDTGSTKEGICSAVRNHKNRKRFVAAHPLAGTENSGPSAAIEGLFRFKKNIICEAELSDSDALQVANDVFRSIGMESIYLDPNEHDKHLAYVSHLSHISSFMLGLTVLDLEKNDRRIANLASTGFESTVRLAKSSPQTWAPIFDKNADHVCTALEQYIEHLTEFLNILKNKETERSIELMRQANDVRRILNDIKT